MDVLCTEFLCMARILPAVADEARRIQLGGSHFLLFLLILQPALEFFKLGRISLR